MRLPVVVRAWSAISSVPEAVKIQLENWFGAAFEKTDPVLARRVLKYMHVDSWNAAARMVANFLAEFQERRGYDLFTLSAGLYRSPSRERRNDRSCSA